MTLITKPDFTYVWASGGAVVAPNDAKKQLGWVAEAPPFQYDNWLQNRQDQMLAHINQRGIAAWDALTNYEAAGLSYVQGSDGIIYKSVAASGPASVVSNPTTDITDTYWKVAFASSDTASETVQGVVELATTVEAQAGTDDLRAMTPLKVRQAIAQFGSDFINTTRINVASAATVNLTTAATLNTRHISITGTTTITSFTVAVGQCYFVSFSGALTLTNNANIVTNTDGNIVTAAGDSCIIRATAANTVEIICGDFLAFKSIGVGQTWQDLTASRALGTTYTNTTGRSITVSASIFLPNTAVVTLVVGGVVMARGSAAIINYTDLTVQLSAIVPPGQTYSLQNSGATPTIRIFSELR